MLSLTIDCLDIMAIWSRQEVRLQKTLMQDKEEKKVKTFTGLSRTCRLDSCNINLNGCILQIYN